MKWFDRRFNFDTPVWIYPNLVERLRGTPARVEDLTKELDDHVLISNLTGHWSIQEHVGHLLDLEALWLGRIDDFVGGKGRLRDADLENSKTFEAEHNNSTLMDILSSFRIARGSIVERLEEMGVKAAGITATHPRLEQPMRLLDLVYFVAEHDDHHLAAISQLKRTIV